MRRIVSKELRDKVRDKVDSFAEREDESIHDVGLSLTDAIIAFNSAMKATFCIMMLVIAIMMFFSLLCKSGYMIGRTIEIGGMLTLFYLMYLVLINVGFFACVLSVMRERSKDALKN